jgi:phospholipid transport system substrate-binding protein
MNGRPPAARILAETFRAAANEAAMLRRTLLAAAALLPLVAAPPAALADVVADSRAMIATMANDVIAILSNKGLGKADREARFRAIFRARFDIGTIGPWVMGRPWQDATPAQRQEYMALFETYIVKVYTAQLGSYSGERLDVVGAEADDSGAAVTTRIVGGGRPIDIVWRLRRTGAALRVRDVVIENISMSLNQRREFAAVYQSRGGTVDGLLQALRDKIAELDRR